MNELAKYDNLIIDIIDSLNLLTNKALKKNINVNNIIWDPGIGFSKSTSQNLEILKNLEKFKSYDYPLLIGASRKRFIGEILNIKNPKDRDVGSLAISCLCAQFKIHAVRVHNVEFTAQILKVADSIYRF